MIAILALLASNAMAQDEDDFVPQDYPIDVERFRPNSDTYGYAVTESSTTLHNLQVGVAMWGNYSSASVVLYNDGERVIGPAPDYPDAMVDQRSVVNFQTGFGIADVFSFGIDLPVVVWQEGFEPGGPDSPTAAGDLVSAGIGDIRLNPKFVIVDIHDGYPIGLGLLTQITLPTGTTRSFIGEGGVTAMPLLALEVADGSVHDREYVVRGAINAGARIKEIDRFRDIDLGPEFVYRAALGAHPAPAIEIGADLAGAVGGSRSAQLPIEILPWMKLFPVDWVTVTAGAGFGLQPGLGSPDIRFFAGGTIAPSFDPLQLDRDGDGIPNKFDQCINIPEDHDGWQDEDGCPEDDNDADGILDVSDSCPNDPEDYDDFQDADGCPDDDNDQDRILDVHDSCPNDPEDIDDWEDLDGCPEPDNDQDGILDINDACPNAAETFNGYDDDDGCPDEKPHVDTDGDGYVDEADGCPFDPEDFDGWQDEDGCPDADNDLDGIFDTVDSCPFDPETPNGYLDEDGCPDEAPSRVVVTRTKIEIKEKIFFEYNKAVIQPLSFELLNEVALVINDHPHIQRIRIEGHTDSDGSDSYNQKLSQKRAEAVREFLANAGVDGARLEAVGYGEDTPIDTNKTTEGKAKNRRVEFTILQQEDL